MFTDPTALFSLGGVIVTAFLGFLGIQYTARSSRNAQEQATKRAAELERTKVDAQAYQRARENYDSALSVMQGQIEALKSGREYDRQEHTRQIGELRDRVRELDEARRADRATIVTLAAYARVLLSLLRDNSIAYPPPPPDLSQH